MMQQDPHSPIDTLSSEMGIKIGAFLTPGEATKFNEANRRKPQLTSNTQLFAFKAKCELIFPQLLSSKERLNIYIVLQKLDSLPENWATLLEQFENQTLKEDMKNRLVAICKQYDPAMAYRVMDTPLLSAALPSKERRYPPNLSSKILGGLIGFSAALLKPLVHLTHIKTRVAMESILGTLFALFYAIFSIKIALTLTATLVTLALISAGYNMYRRNIVLDMNICYGIAKSLISPILLLVSMADAIYQGYKLGHINALDNYDRLLTYSAVGLLSLRQALHHPDNHDAIYPPIDGDRRYFKPFYRTVADISGDCPRFEPREAESNAPIQGMSDALRIRDFRFKSDELEQEEGAASRNWNDDGLTNPLLQAEEKQSDPISGSSAGYMPVFFSERETSPPSSFVGRSFLSIN